MSQIPDAFANLAGPQRSYDRLRLQDAQNVQAGQGRQAEVHGRQSRNLFARFTDFVRRTPAEVADNKAVAQALVDGIRNTYGNKIGNMAGRELSAQLKHGRPLTAYRLTRVMKHVDTNMDRIAAGNARVLRNTTLFLYRDALQRLDHQSDGPLSTERYKDAIEQAVRRDSRFSREVFSDFGHLYSAYREIAAEAVRQQHMETLAPNTARLVAPEEERYQGAYDLLAKACKELMRVNVLQPDHMVNCLDLYARVRTQIMSLEPSRGPDEGYRIAMCADLGQVRDLLADRIGFSLNTDQYQERDQDYLLMYHNQLLDMRVQLQTQPNTLDIGMSRFRLDAAIEYLDDELLDNKEDNKVVSDRMRALATAVRAEVLAVMADLDRFDEAWFTREELNVLSRAGQGLATGLAYREAGIPIHPRTMVDGNTDTELIGEPRPLSGGLLSVPYAVSFARGNGEPYHAVFKAVIDGKEGYSAAAVSLGIDPDNPQMPVRNVATRVVDELLGFDIVPETGIGMVNGRPGLVMAFAHGAAPLQFLDDEADPAELDCYRQLLDMLAADVIDQEDFDDRMANRRWRVEGKDIKGNDKLVVGRPVFVSEIDYDDANLRRELVKLQLLDAVTAQGDRHSGNYIVELDEDGRFERLQAIDNDQCFGLRIRDPDGLRPGVVSFDFLGVGLPPVVDTQMQAAVNQLDPDDLRQELRGLLPEDEIDCAIARLVSVKEHVNSDRCIVISPEEWGGEVATEALSDPETSFVGRDKQRQQTQPTVAYSEVRA